MKGLFLEQQQSNIKTTVHNKRIFMTWKIKQDCFALQATQMCTVRFKLHKCAQYTSSYTNVHSHLKLHKCTQYTSSYTNVHSTLQATQMCTVHFKLHKCAQYTCNYLYLVPYWWLWIILLYVRINVCVSRDTCCHFCQTVLALHWTTHI